MIEFFKPSIKKIVVTLILIGLVFIGFALYNNIFEFDCNKIAVIKKTYIPGNGPIGIMEPGCGNGSYGDFMYFVIYGSPNSLSSDPFSPIPLGLMQFGRILSYGAIIYILSCISVTLYTKQHLKKTKRKKE